MKKLLIVLLILAIALMTSLFACGSKDDAENVSEDPVEQADTSEEQAEEPVQVKPVPIPETMTSNENNKSLDELIVDVGRNARFETNELADAMLKAEREEEKKVAKKETAEKAVAEEKKAPAEEKKPAKIGRAHV